MYGCDPHKPSFARACLLARRMVERGVRFITSTTKAGMPIPIVVGNHKDELRRNRPGRQPRW